MGKDLPAVHLKPKRDKKIRCAYPWVQREEVVRADPMPDGDVAQLIDADGQFLAVGTYNSISRFPFRVLSLVPEAIDTQFFARRFQEAALRRQRISGTDSVRLVFAEADRLPGLIIDRYGDVFVVQVRGLGMERLKPLWLPALIEEFAPTVIYEKSEMEGRKEEGLPPFAGVLHGELPDLVVMDEDGLKYEVPVVEGLKTGFYLDQRETRRQFARLVRPGDRVLDAFCYSGAFSCVAARSGAQTLGIDIHEFALETAKRNAARNGLACEFQKANAFEWLEADTGEPFDWIVLDPPAIAKTRDKKDSLKWGIWKLVYHAAERLKPGGMLLVCNCSYQLSLAETVDIVRLGLSDKGLIGILEDVTIQAPDHPYLVQFPESFYLKCLWIRVQRTS
jgi:23S rRNA (cytosine1962-C5)-methyltransferase